MLYLLMSCISSTHYAYFIIKCIYLLYDWYVEGNAIEATCYVAKEYCKALIISSPSDARGVTKKENNTKILRQCPHYYFTRILYQLEQICACLFILHKLSYFHRKRENKPKAKFEMDVCSLRWSSSTNMWSRYHNFKYDCA